MRALFLTFSWQDLRRHPWRSLAAVVAVMLGVALAFAVHVINASALDEFSRAVRAVNGQPDVEVRAAQGTLPEQLYASVATHPQVARASPVLELSATAVHGTARVPLRIVGADALLLPAIAPDLMPRLSPQADRLDLFAPATVFLNGAALQALGLGATAADALLPLTLQTGLTAQPVRVAGTVAAGGAPLAVMDIGAAQDLFGRVGHLTRIDVQLQPGADHAAWQQALRALPDWPVNAVFAEPGDAAQRVSNLSRAYRVNLTVLALVALFTGAFLVFSVLALSVARRAPQFALLAVLGATPRQRLALVLAESAALGLLGSALGIALGTALAAIALRLLGGDLGGGYFAGVQPTLQWSVGAAAVYGALGVVAALVGGWWPARTAQALPPAQTLKGLGTTGNARRSPVAGMVLIAFSALLASAPPVFGIPLAAYAAVGLLLIGGIALLPWLVQGLLRALHPLVRSRALPLLAAERARRMHGSAAVAVGGVVASLSLAVALTVMVTSFRGSVAQWLDAVLPAPLYVRLTSSGTAGADDTAATFPPGFAEAVARLPGVERVQPQRVSSLLLDPTRPAVALLAKPLGDDPAQSLPLVGAPVPVPAGRVGVYVSEAIVQLYSVKPGMDWPALSASFSPLALTGQAQPAMFYVAGVWRDYVRQFGAITLDRADYLRLTGDERTTDLALWPTPGADEAAMREAITALARGPQPSPPNNATSPIAQPPPATAPAAAPADGDHLSPAAPSLQFSSAAAIRERSLGIFDRSFAVTYWLQAVAIGIGLFGVAASFSAQVLARRKEFGLLAHLGLTRRQILTVVAGEGAAWTAIGAVAGTALGLAVSVVLVHVVNPQSFHWTMELRVPEGRLLALAAAVVLAGTVTAWVAGRSAAGRDAVMAVKEDW